MRYLVILKKKGTKETTDTKTIMADNYYNCLEKVKEYIQTLKNPSNIFPSIYCDVSTGEGLMEASLQIVKRVTKTLYEKQKGEGQSTENKLYNLYMGCRVSNVSNPDVLDILQVASLQLYENLLKGVNIEENYLDTFRRVDRYVYAMGAVKQTKTSMRTEYLEDVNEKLFATNTIIAKLTKNPLDIILEYENHNNDIISAQREIIAEIMSTMTPIQKQVIKLVGQGYSERQIAEKLKRSKTTIHQHKECATKKAHQLYIDGYAQIKAILKQY